MLEEARRAVGPARHTRRAFLRAMAALGVIASVAPASVIATSRPAIARSRLRAFRFIHGADIRMKICEPPRSRGFRLEVWRGEKLLEAYRVMTARRLSRVDSDYFEVEYHEPPSA